MVLPLGALAEADRGCSLEPVVLLVVLEAQELLEVELVSREWRSAPPALWLRLPGGMREREPGLGIPVEVGDTERESGAGLLSEVQRPASIQHKLTQGSHESSICMHQTFIYKESSIQSDMSIK